MKFRPLHVHLNQILTTVLQPRCAVCDENHRCPDRLCPACKIAIAYAKRETLAEAVSACRVNSNHRQGLPNNSGSKQPGAHDQDKNLDALDVIVSAFNYQGAIPELITRWKYHGMIELTDYIANLIAELNLSISDHNLVTVIPSHWQRRLTRGFDPVWLLANALAKRCVIDKPVPTLKSRQNLPYQHLKRLDDRYIDSCHFQATERVCGEKVLILDDVITSGATLNAAATALRRAGAQSISGLTIATANTRSIARAAISERSY